MAYNRDEILRILEREILRTEASRYDHRLHGVLLVARGLSCQDVAKLLGNSPRTVAYWVSRFENHGPAGLLEARRPGRTARLGKTEREEIAAVVRNPPRASGLAAPCWDAGTLREFISERWGITLGIRQCQRIFRQMVLRGTEPPGECAPLSGDNG